MGISRAMLDLVARVSGPHFLACATWYLNVLQITVLDSRKRRLRISLKGNSDELRAIHQYFRREAEGLLMELNVWCNSLSALAQHVRVAVRLGRHRRELYQAR
jgi:hypothetical protein